MRISNWSAWRRMFATLPAGLKAAATAVGVHESDIAKLCAGGRCEPSTAARHPRFAAAVTVQQMIDESEADAVARHWASGHGLDNRGARLNLYDDHGIRGSSFSRTHGAEGWGAHRLLSVE